MDLCNLNLSNRNIGFYTAKISPFLLRNSWLETSFSCDLGKRGLFANRHGKFLEIRMSKLRCSSYKSMAVRVMAKKNDENSSSSGSNDQSIPKGDDPEIGNPSFDNTSSEESTLHQSHPVILDWRTVRAKYVAKEQAQLMHADAAVQGTVSHDASNALGWKWAHPIPIPEAGCVLVATEKLDGVRAFERTVVLLLRSGTRDQWEGPFGLIINRPLHKKIKHMNPSNPDLATTLAECSLHFGGPLDASMFLLKTDNNAPIPGFEQVIPGLCFGARNSLDEAAGLVKKGVLTPQDIRFFVGYAGWQMDQLRDEIEVGYWIVAACSADLISEGLATDSSSGLWEEILQLMGGHFSELSKKPKQDTS